MPEYEIRRATEDISSCKACAFSLGNFKCAITNQKRPILHESWFCCEHPSQARWGIFHSLTGEEVNPIELVNYYKEKPNAHDG